MDSHSAHATKSVVSMKSKSMASMSTAAFGSKSMSRMRMRRQSMGYGGVPGIRPIERTSQLGIEFKRPPLLFLNTYQLDPTRKFHRADILKEIDIILDENFTEHKYNAQESTSLVLRLANDIMRKIKSMCYNRYRIIAVVTIGQRRAQCYNNAIAFVWDHERDSYVNAQRELPSAFLQVTVFGVYLD